MGTSSALMVRALQDQPIKSPNYALLNTTPHVLTQRFARGETCDFVRL